VELLGKRFLVVGLGESGLAMTRWLSRQGASVRVADSRENPPNLAALAELAPDVDVIAGPFRPDSFQEVDAIALSPGVARTTPEIVAALEQGVGVISEVDLFMAALEDCQPDAQVLAITGSNGKTTTTALTAHLLNGAGISAVACGNISPSLLDALMAAQDAGELPQVWVLELSSFQLESTRYLPAVAAAVLNVTEDHLDRHGDLSGYANAKARIFIGQAAQVLNREDDWSLGMGGACVHPGRMTTFGLNPPPRAGHYGIRNNAIYCGETRLTGLDELPLQGRHNAANVMAALALCAAIGVEHAQLLPALKSFRGLPHRTEQVAEIAGVRYIDDSKGTNVGATQAAIVGLGGRGGKSGGKVAVILGGDGKGQDFAPLKAVLRAHGRAVALIGRDGPVIGKAIEGCGLPVESCADMSAAVRYLAAIAQPGDCVLLSPACASFDRYKNYAERAADFCAAVIALGAAA
jgi:UDP-N-acetylmuramoylalanine--D-glutamate ligase